MLKIEKWAQDKNNLIALFAPQTVAMAWTAPEAFQHIRERRVFNYQFSLPDYPSWFAMYRRPGKAVLAFTELISEFSEFGSDLLALVHVVRKHRKIARNTEAVSISPEQIEEALEFWKTFLRKSFTDLEDGFSDTPFDPETNDRFLTFSAKRETELGFIMLIYAPCWLLYQESSVSLYKKALDGDVDALVKLLNLDPLLMVDPSISKIIQDIRLTPRTNDYEKILHAATKPINISKDKLKSSLAALILSIAKELKIPLTAAQIRNLFDDYANDTQGTLTDTDIKSPESFDRTMKNKTPQWQKLFQNSENNK